MIPIRVKKAIEIIVGYCNKHKHCDACPLKKMCEERFNLPPCDWLKQEAKK